VCWTHYIHEEEFCWQEFTRAYLQGFTQSPAVPRTQQLRLARPPALRASHLRHHRCERLLEDVAMAHLTAKTALASKDRGCAVLRACCTRWVSSTGTQTARDVSTRPRIYSHQHASPYGWDWHKTGPSIWESQGFCDSPNISSLSSLKII